MYDSHLEDQILALDCVNLEADIPGEDGGRGILGPGKHDRAPSATQAVMQAVVDLKGIVKKAREDIFDTGACKNAGQFKRTNKRIDDTGFIVYRQSG
jgi:hypothetical protein